MYVYKQVHHFFNNNSLKRLFEEENLKNIKLKLTKIEFYGLKSLLMLPFFSYLYYF